jgi:hypothetical protein
LYICAINNHKQSKSKKMALDTPKDTRGPKVLPQAGLQLAVCYQIIDLGTQQTTWKGVPKEAKKVAFSFELPNSLHVFDEKKGPQPLSVHHEYTLSSAEKATLPKVLKAWGSLPKAPHITAALLSNYLGAPCMVNIEHVVSAKDPSITYANIATAGQGINPRMKEILVPTNYPANERLILDLGNFDIVTFSKLPKFVKEKISKSLEWNGLVMKFPQLTQIMAESNAQPSAQAPAVHTPVQPQHQMEQAEPVIHTGNGNPGLPSF